MTDQRFSSDFFGDEEDVRAYARKRISDFFKSGQYPDINAIDAHQRTAIVVDGAEHLADAIIKKIGAGAEPIDLLSLSAALIREFLTKRGFQPGEAKAPSADHLQASDADPEKALLDAFCLATRRLDRPSRMFHLCSHGSRDARDRTQPQLEGPYALRQRLSPRDALHAALRLSQAA